MILDINCNSFAPIMRVLAYLFKFIKFVIPMLLIVLIAIDMVKAVTANDEKAMTQAKSKSFKRVLYALIIFLVPTIVTMIFKQVGGTFYNGDLKSATDWINCYKNYN